MPNHDGPVAPRSRAALRFGDILPACNTHFDAHHFLHSRGQRPHFPLLPKSQKIRARRE